MTLTEQLAALKTAVETVKTEAVRNAARQEAAIAAMSLKLKNLEVQIPGADTALEGINEDLAELSAVAEALRNTHAETPVTESVAPPPAAPVPEEKPAENLPQTNSGRGPFTP